MESSERLVRPARSLAALFERARQPYLWSRTLGALFLLAYAMGVRDRVPTLEQFEELVAPIRRGEGRDSIEVPLGRPGRLGVPPTAGQVDLVLAYGEEQIARVAAPAPRQQWDWNAVAQKVAGEAREPFEEALRRRPGELTELAPGVREVLAS